MNRQFIRLSIRVDKRTQAVKLVCQTLLHAEPGTHAELKNDEEDYKPNYQLYN
jgi:hypothetical protein